MPNKKQLATSQPPKRRAKQQSHAEAEAARIEAVTKILNAPDDLYVNALKDLITNARPPISNFQAQVSLLCVYGALFSQDYRGSAEIARLRRKANDPSAVRRGVELYETMDRLREIYRAKGHRVGPSCYVQQLAAPDHKPARDWE